MEEIEQIKTKYQQLEMENYRIIESFENYRYKLQNQIENINLILNEQSFTIFHSKECYEQQRLEKMRMACTIDNIIRGKWNIDKNGNIEELKDKKSKEAIESEEST